MFVFLMLKITCIFIKLWYNISKETIMEVKDIEINFEDDSCDLNPEKICDNCGRCLDTSKNYKIIKITKIIENIKE